MIYLMKFESCNEVFYKVGKSCDVKRRCKEFNSITDYNVSIVWESPKRFGCDKLEYWFHKDNKKRSYSPLHKFQGAGECYKNLTPAFMRYYFRDNDHLIDQYIERLSFWQSV